MAIMNTDAIDAVSTAIVVRDETQGGVLAVPVCSPAEAKAAMQQYQELCEAVLDDSDYQEFTQKKFVPGQGYVSEKKRFKKKSAVKKLQTFFGVEVVVKDAQRDDLGDGHFAFRVIASARARNGRVVEATGACSTMEERFDLEPFAATANRAAETEEAFRLRQKKALARSYHDVLSTAETRATNRAVMNCVGVGGGEVTADEVRREKPSGGRQPSPARQETPANGTSEAPPDKPKLEGRDRANAALHAAIKKLRETTPYPREDYQEDLVDLFGPARFADAPESKPTSTILDEKELDMFRDFMLRKRGAKKGVA